MYDQTSNVGPLRFAELNAALEAGRQGRLVEAGVVQPEGGDLQGRIKRAQKESLRVGDKPVNRDGSQP